LDVDDVVTRVFLDLPVNIRDRHCSFAIETDTTSRSTSSFDLADAEIGDVASSMCWMMHARQRHRPS
jgi:hypothetical protein